MPAEVEVRLSDRLPGILEKFSAGKKKEPGLGWNSAKRPACDADGDAGFRPTQNQNSHPVWVVIEVLVAAPEEL
ncbi:MAG: hypothetical protein RI932_679 [Pseudomonadota bacterium]